MRCGTEVESSMLRLLEMVDLGQELLVMYRLISLDIALRVRTLGLQRQPQPSYLVYLVKLVVGSRTG